MTPFFYFKTLQTSIINVEKRKFYSNKTRSDRNSSKIVIGKKHIFFWQNGYKIRHISKIEKKCNSKNENAKLKHCFQLKKIMGSIAIS